MRRWTIGLGAALAAVVAASQAVAEPYLAVREGYKCSACHVNMTGGGMRTSFVSAHSRELLHYPDWFARLTKPADSFTGDINQYVGIGADVRTSLTFTTQDDPDKNGNVNNNQAFRTHLQSTDISVYEGVGFLNVNLIPDLLNVYLDERYSPSVDTREFWGMMALPYEIYLKAGQMFLPYGLEIQDDNAFIRGGRNGSATTGFSFFVSQPAFEVGWEPGPMAAAVAVSQGVANDRDVQLTGSDYFMFTDVPVVRSVLAGVSGTYNGGSTETSVFGFWGGFNLAAFTGLGEVDFGHTNCTSCGSTPSTGGLPVHEGTFESYVEGNYLALDWLNVKAAFDYADWDGMQPRAGNDAENRVSFGLEPFLARFLQIRTFYRVSNGIASNPSHNQGLWSAEIHVFF